MRFSLFAKTDPDADLVTAARAGDVRAFDALVYRYQGRLTQLVRARLDSAIDADDVAQEVFVAAWRDLPQFRGRSQFKTWLFGIALNLCAEAARRHMRLRRALGELDAPGSHCARPAWGADAPEWSAAIAEREDIRQRLSELPEPERQVLELYYYADLNLREISQLLDVNLSTLKYRFYQAHRKLRDTLQVEDGAPARKEQKRVRP